ncbi:hypothetical protein BpHYR1_045976 [Brachionus plicatilis]|uniref:Uncharacterized protein n=1 Tax=Brachionus plicatilis TaxID=10195 RepID=A0A3M7T6R1_BRAPC|nr:hypothetical protein BpHYR1_045976 [Brachionus plicatilis]
MAPSRISNEGKWGKKSLPTKKHMNTQSSMARSMSNSNGSSLKSSSLVKYSRSTFSLRKIHARTLFGLVAELSAYFARPGRIRPKFFSDNGKVGLVSGQAEHDQVGVGTAQHVMGIGLVIGIGSLTPNEVHYFVFALARHIGIRQDHADVLPAGIVVESVVDVVSETLGKTVHERGARRDAVRVELFRLSSVGRHLSAVRHYLFFEPPDF